MSALVLVGSLVLTACGGGGDDADTSSAEPAAQYAEEPAEEPVFDADDGGLATRGGEAGGDADSGGFDIGIIGRDVIIEMHVVISSDDVQRTVSSIMAQASALGGGVASSDVDYGTPGEFGDQGYAVLVVKVPPQAVDSLLAGLDDTGTIESINQSSQDVTDQLIDLDVRISNARRSVANVRDFMDRTENLGELVTLEGELTRRQTELERLEAQQRNLKDRVALSTVTIEVVPTDSVPQPVDDEDSIGDAFRKGWDAFAEFIFGIGYVLAVLLPFIVLGGLAALAIWLVIRRRNRRRPAAPTAGDEPPVTQPLTAPQVKSEDVAPANRSD